MLVNSFMTEAVIIRKSVDWFLYDNGLRHERVKVFILNSSRMPSAPLLVGQYRSSGPVMFC